MRESVASVREASRPTTRVESLSGPSSMTGGIGSRKGSLPATDGGAIEEREHYQDCPLCGQVGSKEAHEVMQLTVGGTAGAETRIQGPVETPRRINDFTLL